MLTRKRRTSPILAVAAVALAMLTAPVARMALAEEYPLVEAQECRARGGLPNVLAKLAAGGDVRIAYIGGSITAQAGYRVKTLAWFREQFPKANVIEVNAAIGGTGSDLGVFRHAHDVLRHKPDLVFVEFAVNDGGAPPAQIHRAMEGIVRQTWRADAATDIAFVYTITESLAKPLIEGKFPRAASAMEAVADHYGIPSIHMAMEVARLAREGKLLWAAPLPKTDEAKAALGDKVVFANDSVHPYTETGHQLYLEAVVRSMERIRAAGKPGPHAMPAPLVADNWENARMVPLSALKPGDGWQRIEETNGMAKRWLNRMPEFWKTDKAGTTLEFKFKGTSASVYDLLGPDCGQVIVTLDGGPPRTVPRFDRYCTGHRLATLVIGRNLPDGEHTVKLELAADPPDKVEIFRKGKQAAEDPATNPKYKGIAWYAGAVLLTGEIVP